MGTMITDYTQKFIQLQIVKHIPKGVDPYLHIDLRKEMYKILMDSLESGRLSNRLSVIKLIIVDYKYYLWEKYSYLN
jgi:hypothetical protein